MVLHDHHAELKREFGLLQKEEQELKSRINAARHKSLSTDDDKQAPPASNEDEPVTMVAGPAPASDIDKQKELKAKAAKYANQIREQMTGKDTYFWAGMYKENGTECDVYKTDVEKGLLVTKDDNALVVLWIIQYFARSGYPSRGIGFGDTSWNVCKTYVRRFGCDYLSSITFTRTPAGQASQVTSTAREHVGSSYYNPGY